MATVHSGSQDVPLRYWPEAVGLVFKKIIFIYFQLCCMGFSLIAVVGLAL